MLNLGFRPNPETGIGPVFCVGRASVSTVDPRFWPGEVLVAKCLKFKLFYLFASTDKLN
jgi:hypothetical protein